MTPTKWIAARRAMLAKKTKGPWKHRHSEGDTPADDIHEVVQVERGAHFSIALLRSWEHRAENAALIVAAVNEQEAVVALVEAVAAFDEAEPTFGDLISDHHQELRAALAALVGEQEKSG